MKKWIYSLFIIAVIIVSTSMCTYAFSHTRHDDYLEQVLFGPGKYKGPAEGKAIINRLDAASYLTIDQFNGSGKKQLQTLKEAKIIGIPKSIVEIDYSASGNGEDSNHRTYTHRGWDYSYQNDKAHWTIRKNILRSTVSKEMGFGSIPCITKTYSKQCDSFCALIYYTHILGDRIYDKNYINPVVEMDVGGRNDSQDIISEIKKHSEILFSKSKKGNDRVYNSFISQLDALNKKYKKLNIARGVTGSSYVQYHEYSIELMDILINNIPMLLSKEDFFKNTFYKDEK